MKFKLPCLRLGRKTNLSRREIEKTLDKLVKTGHAVRFDDSFYAQFDDLYFNGLPVYYHLKAMSMGHCYDASALLALAMGNRPDTYVCRGELTRLNTSIMDFGHGWVERGNAVYDTTWQIKVNRDDYYDLFQVQLDERTKAPEFLQPGQCVGGWRLYHRADYETGRVMVPSGTIRIAREIEEMHLADNPTPAQAEFSQKFLNDLPDLTKCRPLAGNAEDFSMFLW